MDKDSQFWFPRYFFSLLLSLIEKIYGLFPGKKYDGSEK